MPTRLRREAARWGDSKLAELLAQAAEQMETAAGGESVAHFVALALKEKGAREQAEAQLAATRAEVARLTMKNEQYQQQLDDRWVAVVAQVNDALSENKRLEAQLAASRAQIADHQTELVDLRRQLDERDASLAREKQGRMEWARRYGESRAEGERLRGALEPFRSGGDWGTFKAALVHGPQSSYHGLEMARRLTAWQVAVDAALTPASPGAAGG